MIASGIGILTATLKKYGHSVDIFDTTFYQTSKETGDMAREKSLQIIPSNNAKLQSFIEIENVDAVCRGEGKEVLSESDPLMLPRYDTNDVRDYLDQNKKTIL